MKKIKGKQILPIFQDNVECPELFAEVKYFKIQHPTKIDRSLIHSCLEGPENAVYLRNTINIDKKKSGKIFIKFPDFWEGLIDRSNVSIQITPIGGYSKYYIDNIKNNYYIMFDDNYAAAFSIFVIAERIDVPKLIVEPEEYYSKEEYFKD